MRKNKAYSSTRFLQKINQAKKREIFPDGDWINIQENLALSGWDAMQRDIIHSSLKTGVSLSFAVRKASERIGSCPIRSKAFF